MNRSTSRASTSQVIAAVDKEKRDSRITRISRWERFPKARRKERSGAAIAGQTVFPALVSSTRVRHTETYQVALIVNHRIGPTTEPRQNYGTRSCDNDRNPRTQ